MIVSTSAGAHQNSKLLFFTKLHPSNKLLRFLLVKSDIRKYFWSALTGGVRNNCEIMRKIQVSYGVVVEFNEVDSPHLLGPCLYNQFVIATVINIDII
jgi:hypothetical protein